MALLKDKMINLLRWSEKYTRTDMVYLTTGSFWLVGSYVFNTILLFGLTVLLANSLPKEIYGNYKYVLSLAGMLSGFSLSGMGTAITQSVARGFEGILLKSFWANLQIGFGLFSTSAFAIAIYYFIHGNSFLGISLTIVALFYPPMISTGYSSAFINGKKDFSQYSKYQLIRNIIPTVIIALVAILSDSPTLLIAANVVGYALVSSAIFILTIKKYHPNRDVEEASFKYGKHLSVMSFFSTFTNRFDSLIIFQRIGAAPLALYSLATAIPDQIIGLLKNLHFLALPKLATRETGLVKSMLIQKSALLGIVSSLIYIVYFLAVPTLFKVFFPIYLDAIPLARLFGLNIILASIGTLPGTFLDSHSETKKKYFFTVTVTISKIALMTILIFPYGIVGVIMGELLSRIISIFLLAILIRRL